MYWMDATSSGAARKTNGPDKPVANRVRILILGASGGVGRWVTRFAAQEGHQLTALVRPATSFLAPQGVVVQRGSVLEAADMSRAIERQEIVISCVGSQRANPRNPWSPLRPPPHIAERATQVLVDTVKAAGIRRVAAISAAGVGDSAEKANAVINWLVRHSTVGEMYADLERMEKVLVSSGLHWLAVRPGTLIDAAPSKRTKVLSRFRLHSVVGRADVAAWLLRAATDPQPIRERTPIIGWR